MMHPASRECPRAMDKFCTAVPPASMGFSVAAGKYCGEAIYHSRHPGDPAYVNYSYDPLNAPLTAPGTPPLPGAPAPASAPAAGPAPASAPPAEAPPAEAPPPGPVPAPSDFPPQDEGGS